MVLSFCFPLALEPRVRMLLLLLIPSFFLLLNLVGRKGEGQPLSGLWSSVKTGASAQTLQWSAGELRELTVHGHTAEGEGGGKEVATMLPQSP